MAFVFGETPAQAGRMGYEIAERNRAAQIAAQDNEARYAFQANQLANERALQQISLQNQAQQYANQLASEQEANAERRFQFGVGQQQQREALKRADDWQRFQFNNPTAAQREAFDLQREQATAARTQREEAESNAGNALAGALSEIQPAYDTALARFHRAQDKLNRITQSAVEVGLLLNKQTGAFSPRNPAIPPETVESWTKDYADWKSELEDASKAIPLLQKDLATQRQQARSSGYTVEPTGVRHLRTGTWFPMTAQGAAEATAAPATNPAWVPPQNITRRGQRVRQDGREYEFDGTNWNAVTR